ncbi:MAG: acyl carrier protein [Bacteroidetes bacterium]|nr:acyl carrier protein [Bacteroidota bacterium]
MTEDQIKSVVFRLLKTVAPDTDPTQLKPGDNIRQSLSIDSFDYLQFIVGLDKELGIQTPEEDYGKIGTLKELVEYVSSRRPLAK